jgi:hypothetical protein
VGKGLVESGHTLFLEAEPYVVHVDAHLARAAITASAASTAPSMVRTRVPWSSKAATVASAGC